MECGLSLELELCRINSVAQRVNRTFCSGAELFGIILVGSGVFRLILDQSCLGVIGPCWSRFAWTLKHSFLAAFHL